MTQNISLGNRVRPLRNVAQLSLLIDRLENRAHGLPGMGVLHGPTGYGKSYAAIHAVLHQDVIHISMQEAWTRKTVLKAILMELGVVFRPSDTIPDLMEMVNKNLAVSNRTLILDEADYAIDKGMIQMIRDIHDGSSAAIVLIGMEALPQKLRKYELVDGRILDWKPAQPTDLADARELAKVYAAGITVDDALLEHIIAINNGKARRISADLAYVLEESKLQGATSMSLDGWGDVPFLRGEAPQPRAGL